MDRFSRQERRNYKLTQMASGQKLTSPQVAAIDIECDRHLPSESSAEGAIYIIGSDPDNHFDMPELLEEGETGGYVHDFGDGPVETGYQLVPMISGTGINQANTAPVGGSNDSTPFDGVSEIHAGLYGSAVQDMLQIEYSGQYLLTANVLPEPVGNNNNKELEGDLFIFDSAGNLKFPLQILASVNNSGNGKSNTMVYYPVTIESTAALEVGDCIGLVLRKAAGETGVTPRIKKCSIFLTLLALKQD